VLLSEKYRFDISLFINW